MSQLDAFELEEWTESLDAVLRHNGPQATGELIKQLSEHAESARVPLPSAITTPFRNTISPEDERPLPGDLFMERRIRSLVRWNALAMVMRANDNEDGLGGHISSFSSSATLYDVGVNHFFRGTANGHPGDLVYYQGHSAPGMYARSYLEGVLSEAQLENFRREVGGEWLVVLPTPLADARLLAVSYCIDGVRSLTGDLPSSRDEVPEQAGSGGSSRSENLVFHG
jgi:pyruvate dehydrogenase E1 component